MTIFMHNFAPLLVSITRKIQNKIKRKLQAISDFVIEVADNRSSGLSGPLHCPRPSSSPPFADAHGQIDRIWQLSEYLKRKNIYPVNVCSFLINFSLQERIKCRNIFIFPCFKHTLKVFIWYKFRFCVPLSLMKIRKPGLI